MSWTKALAAIPIPDNFISTCISLYDPLISICRGDLAIDSFFYDNRGFRIVRSRFFAFASQFQFLHYLNNISIPLLQKRKHKITILTKHIHIRSSDPWRVRGAVVMGSRPVIRRSLVQAPLEALLVAS